MAAQASVFSQLLEDSQYVAEDEVARMIGNRDDEGSVGSSRQRSRSNARRKEEITSKNTVELKEESKYLERIKEEPQLEQLLRKLAAQQSTIMEMACSKMVDNGRIQWATRRRHLWSRNSNRSM